MKPVELDIADALVKSLTGLGWRAERLTRPPRYRREELVESRLVVLTTSDTRERTDRVNQQQTITYELAYFRAFDDDEQFDAAFAELAKLKDHFTAADDDTPAPLGGRLTGERSEASFESLENDPLYEPDMLDHRVFLSLISLTYSLER